MSEYQGLRSLKPEVIYLPALLRGIRQGRIRVPAFQREIVWTQSQMVELIESVYNGYPIGSLLLWRVESKLFDFLPADGLPFPSVDETFPVDYLLDGLQRLGTLYGALGEYAEQNSDYLIWMDLRDETFLASVEKPGEHFFPMASLFDPVKLINVQRHLLDQEDGSVLVERSIRLQSAFQEYLIPTVTLGSTDVLEVVRVFERINSTGTKLSPVDFVRAITWSSNFDLNEAISQFEAEMEKFAYVVSRDTIVKSLSLILGYGTTSTSVLSLRELSAANLNAGVGKFLEVFPRVCKFLRERLYIEDYGSTAYEGLFLAVLAFYATLDENFVANEVILEKWCWYVTFSEGFRGKPDHFVERHVDSARLLGSGRVPSLSRQSMWISGDLFLDKALRKNSAVTAGLASMFRSRRPISLISLKPVLNGVSDKGHESRRMYPILSREDLYDALSDKVLANIWFGNFEDAGRWKDIQQQGLQAIAVYLEGLPLEAKASQFINEELINCLREDNPEGFIIERNELMLAAARQLAFEYSEEEDEWV